MNELPGTLVTFLPLLHSWRSQRQRQYPRHPYHRRRYSDHQPKLEKKMREAEQNKSLTV